MLRDQAISWCLFKFVYLKNMALAVSRFDSCGGLVLGFKLENAKGATLSDVVSRKCYQQ